MGLADVLPADGDTIGEAPGAAQRTSGVAVIEGRTGTCGWDRSGAASQSRHEGNDDEESTYGMHRFDSYRSETFGGTGRFPTAECEDSEPGPEKRLVTRPASMLADPVTIAVRLQACMNCTGGARVS